MSHPDKFTNGLAAKLRRSSEQDVLDIVVEVAPSAPVPRTPSAGVSRAAAIAAQKQAFFTAAEPIEAVIRLLGGEVTDRAWITQSMRARMPAGGLRRLAQHDRVTTVDLPRGISADAGPLLTAAGQG